MGIGQYDLELKVLDLLEEFEDKIDNLSPIPLTGKVMIDREEIQEIIREINILLPEEYQHVKWIKSQKIQIIDEAQRTAERLVSNAQSEEAKILEEAKNEDARMRSELENHMRSAVEEHEIVRQAKGRAEEIITEAKRQALQMKTNAYAYTEDLLLQAREHAHNLIQTIDKNREEIEKYRPERHT